MKNFIVYDSQTGTIKRCGLCQDIDFKLQIRDGESIMEGSANDDTQKVDLKTNTIVSRTDIVEREAKKLERRAAGIAKRAQKQRTLENIARNPNTSSDVKAIVEILLEGGV